ncbi:polysaccharide biosynthesis/export family protein [Cognatishimia sp.]|uniref:polysaccharide biosynthesis/export family protein n=1 Tax=Cognatishimia sp. TaxID=2211648 RepID=UPI0035145AB4
MNLVRVPRRTFGALVALLAFGGLAACSLPTQGPSAEDIVTQSAEGKGYELVPITAKIANRMSETYSRGFSKAFLDAPIQTTSSRLGMGDAVAIRIFEAGGGGLFSNSDGTVSIPRIVVSPTGTISIPYVPNIRALDRTPKEIEEQIVEALSGKALEPQVIVTLAQDDNNTVTIQGAVARPARVPLRVGGNRLSEVFVASGGPRFPAHQVEVSVTRDGVTSTASMQRILEDPRQNIALRSGDIITANHKPRSFTIMGSVNRPAHFPFEKENLSIMEAVGRASGLLDQRADATSVFLFRRESSRTLRSYGLTASDWWRKEKRGVPTVYWLDLSQPEALFHAQTAPMRNGDLIYVANADSVELGKALSIFGLALSTTNSAITVAE